MPDNRALHDQVEHLLVRYIPDPESRRRAAATITAHFRADAVRVLRRTFDPYLAATHSLHPDTAADLMRSAILRVAGFRASEQMSEPDPTIGEQRQ